MAETTSKGELTFYVPEDLAKRLTLTGYTPLPNQTVQQWLDDGKCLFRIEHATQWAIGDWMNHGERRFGQQASQALGWSKSPEWWEQTQRVAGSVPPENRVHKLSWSHHQAVAALQLQDQRVLLQRALDGKWDRDHLRAEVSLIRNNRTPLEIERRSEAAAAYRAAKEGTGTADTAPVPKIDDLIKEARDAKKAAAIKKYQERRDLQERKAAEVAERKRAEARGEKLLPRVIIPEPEGVVYDVVLADPWRDQGTTLADATALQVADLAAGDSVLFMWSGGMTRLRESLALLEAWGFDYRGHMSWYKTKGATVTPYTREQHELLLIGRRGNPKMPPERDRPPSTIEAAAPRQGEHPSIFLEILERMFPHAKRLVVLPPPGDLPRSHRDKWRMWDAQPKGTQRAQHDAVDEQTRGDDNAHPTFEPNLLGGHAAAAARDGDRLPNGGAPR